MISKVRFHRGATLVRRLRIEPGEALPWHRDPYSRVSVVLSGDALAIEFRDGRETLRVDVAPGQVDWDEPAAHIHRAVNVGSQPSEEVVVFLMDRPDADPRPSAG